MCRVLICPTDCVGLTGCPSTTTSGLQCERVGRLSGFAVCFLVSSICSDLSPSFCHLRSSCSSLASLSFLSSAGIGPLYTRRPNLPGGDLLCCVPLDVSHVGIVSPFFCAKREHEFVLDGATVSQFTSPLAVNGQLLS